MEPPNLNATWRNRRVGEDKISKRLDKFLIGEDVVSSTFQLTQWVEGDGDSNHNLIMLDIKGDIKRPPSPFKFNA